MNSSLPINHERRVYKTCQHIEDSIEQVGIICQTNNPSDHQLDQEGGPVGDGLEVLGDGLEHATQKGESKISIFISVNRRGGILCQEQGYVILRKTILNQAFPFVEIRVYNNVFLCINYKSM